MFLVSQDHDQKPKSAHKILAKLSQTEMFKREQKVGQWLVQYLHVHLRNQTYQNQRADMI